ncbi:MAG: DEAD/DEAH box helicase family protein, partial [Lamprobacter sp.]|uniref:DEAD/DEAH box helicase family protein n=1 Tax=Lamprobacter sp. TaxID=3100796 RepID=UPI002B25D263
YVDARKKQLVTDYQALREEDCCTDAQTTARRAMELRPDPVNEVHEVLRGQERQRLILAPTGSGKSYAAAHYTLEEIAVGHAVVYVAANKSDAAQFEEEILRLAEKDSLTDLAGVRHYRQDWTSDAEGSSTDAVDLTRKRLVITHHTFLGHQGDSSYFYDLWRKMEHAVSEAGVELTLIVDEVDAMVESCLRVIDLDSRFKRTHRLGDTEPTYQPLQRCPAFTRSGNCENCELVRDTLRWKVNGNNLFQLYNPKVKHHDDPNRCVSPTLRYNGEPVTWGQFQVQSMSRHDTYAQSIDFSAQLPFDATTGGRQAYDPIKEMNSLLHSAWKPRVLQSQIVENDEGEQRFPARPCGVRSLVLADQAPFKGLRRFRVRYMTASLTPSQQRFIEDTIPELDIQDIEPESQALDKITVIIADHHLSKKDILDLASLQRSLIVTGFQRDTSQFDVRLPGKRIALYSESSTRVAIHDLGVDGPPDILVTYARSSTTWRATIAMAAQTTPTTACGSPMSGSTLRRPSAVPAKRHGG